MQILPGGVKVSFIPATVGIAQLSNNNSESATDPSSGSGEGSGFSVGLGIFGLLVAGVLAVAAPFLVGAPPTPPPVVVAVPAPAPASSTLKPAQPAAGPTAVDSVAPSEQQVRTTLFRAE